MERRELEMSRMSVAELKEFIERCSWSGCGSLQSIAEGVLRTKRAEANDMDG